MSRQLRPHSPLLHSLQAAVWNDPATCLNPLAAQLRHLWKCVQSWGQCDQFGKRIPWPDLGARGMVPQQHRVTSDCQGARSGTCQQRLDLEPPAKEAVATERRCPQAGMPPTHQLRVPWEHGSKSQIWLSTGCARPQGPAPGSLPDNSPAQGLNAHSVGLLSLYSHHRERPISPDRNWRPPVCARIFP